MEHNLTYSNSITRDAGPVFSARKCQRKLGITCALRACCGRASTSSLALLRRVPRLQPAALHYLHPVQP